MNKQVEANLSMVVSKALGGLNMNALKYLLPLWIAPVTGVTFRLVFGAAAFWLIEVGFEVEGEADRLEVEAGQAHFNRMWWFIVGSILAVSIVIVASLLGYRMFKRRYYRRLLKMRSRVE